MAEERQSMTEFPGQHPDEKIELVFRQHPIVLRWPLIWGMLAILIGVIPLLLFPLSNLAVQIALIVPLGSLVYWGYEWIGYHYSVFILTDSRLIDIRQKGFFNRKVSEVGLDKIQSVNYHIKGMQAVLFKFGNIIVQTYTDPWVLKTVSHPEEVHTHMMRVIRAIDANIPGR